MDNKDNHYLKQLNNLSHKISKPIINKKPNFDLHRQTPPPPPQQQQQPQQQPRVYNISKNDFRDVVQRLTGSPAHDSFSNPPPIQPPKPPSSRLQRIRPPPLAQVSNRPPTLINNAVPPPQQQQQQHLPPPPVHNGMNPVPPPAAANAYIPRPPPGPLSPLLPSPAFNVVAESPVSAYMRYLQNSISSDSPAAFSGFSPLAPLVSPRWNNLPSQQQPPLPQQNQPPFAPPPMPQQAVFPSPTSGMIAPQPPFQVPNSPAVPIGFLNSPRSPYPLLSPSTLLSPYSFPLSPYSFPLSPTVPLRSPGWRGV